MGKKTRVTIYALYCPIGQLLESDIFLLEELSQVSEDLIIIVNGNLRNSELLYKYTPNIIFRENIGFDAAAYKYVLSDINYGDLIAASEELVLCNNSFFGPFESFASIFNRMEKDACDFWGITSVKHDIVEHIQSYFIVFRKRIIEKKLLFAFFEKYISYDMTYDDVCREFEIGLYNWLISLGYKPSAYIQNITCDNYNNYYGSVKIDKVPVIKRKAFSKHFFDSTRMNEALKYVYENYIFDINIILKDVDNLYERRMQLDEIKKAVFEDVKPDIFNSHIMVDKSFIDQFINKHNNIYIYGTGDIGKHIYNCFFYSSNREKLLGFVESDNVENPKHCFIGRPVYKYSDIKNENVPIILAMSEKNTKEVKLTIDEDINILQLWITLGK